ncbi:MAG: hypothetical protein AAF721_22470 [Myxococcota bacterium]
MVALAFVVGATGFAGLAVPVVVGLSLDYVPVVPLAVVLVLTLGFAGGIAAAIGAARTWWTFLLIENYNLDDNQIMYLHKYINYGWI